MDFDYFNLINHAAIGLARFQIKDGLLLHANRHLVRMFGYETSEQMSDHFEFNPPHIVGVKLPDVLSRLHSAPDTPIEIAALKYDGTTQRVQIRGCQRTSQEWVEVVMVELKLPALAEAVDALSTAISIYDSEDRRIYANRQFDLQNEAVGDRVALGVTFESYIRKLVQTGNVSEAIGREEDWVKQRLEMHKNPQGVLVIDRGEHGWMQVDEQRLPNGGSIILSSDITPIKQTEVVLTESAARLRRIMNSSPIAATIVDETGRYLYANERAAGCFGLERAQLEGRMSQDFFLNISDRTKILYEIQEKGYANDVETRLKRDDGSEFWALISVYLDPDNAGHKIAWYYDVDERQIAHQKLVELSAAIEAMPEPIAIFDKDDRYTFTNQAIRDGAARAGAPIKLGMKFENQLWNLVSCGAVEDIGGDATDWVNKRMALHRGPQNSFELAHAGGIHYQIIDMELTGGGRMTLLTDISTFKNTQLQLADARDQAEIANKAKSEFLAIVSHELRTPLTSIKGSLGLLAGTMAGELSEDGRSLLEMANRNSDTLLGLINDLLDFEKIVSGNMVLKTSAHNISLITGDLVEVLGGYAESHGVTIRFRMPSDSIWAELEKHRYEQVMRNLISNAAKFSEPGSEVTITMRCSKKQVRVNVIDQGVGISASDRKRVFDHFTQVDSSDIRSRSGTGLGLPISKALVESMGGTIGCRSRLGSGSTFYITLPLLEQLPNAEKLTS